MDDDDAAFLSEVASREKQKLALERKQAKDDEVAFLAAIAAKSALQEDAASDAHASAAVQQQAESREPGASQGGSKRPRGTVADEATAASPGPEQEPLTVEQEAAAKRRRASQPALPSAAALLHVRTKPQPSSPAPAEPAAAPAPVAAQAALVGYSSSDESEDDSDA